MSETQQKCQKLFSACMSGDRFALVQVIKSEGIKPSAYDMVDDQGKTALHVACRYGHIDVVRTLIEVYGCSRQAVDNTGSTPFHDACYYDQVVILDYLIHSSVAPKEDLLAIDVHGNTCFHKANEAGSSRVINYILYIVFSGSTPQKYYLDINSLLHPSSQTLPDINMCYFLIANKAGDTPIAVACRHGRLNIIKLYVHCCEILFGVLDELKDLFSIASSSGQFEIAYYLQCKLKCRLSPSVSPSQVNMHSKLSFIRAIQVLQNPTCHCSSLYCHHRSEEALQSLQSFEIIKSKSNWNIGDFGFDKCSSNDCKFHLCMAVLHKNEEFTSKFLALQGSGVYHCNDFNLCVAACVADDVSALKNFLSKQVEKNIALCNVLLILACEWGSKDIVEFLVTTERCNLHTRNCFGETPLHIACKFDREEIVKMLCESDLTGITINALSDFKETPLHLASVRASPAVAKHIFKNEHLSIGSFDIPNIYGDTPLMNACRSGNVELVQLLVENGSNPLFVNDQLKEMPIHIACGNQRLDMLQILVNNLHAKVDDRNYLGETPLCVALKFFCTDIVNFLVDRQLCDVSLQLCLPDSNSRQMQQFKQIMIPEVHDSGEHSKSTGDSALHFACKVNDVQLIQLLLSHCPQAVSLKNNLGNTPFHIAAENGNVSVMKCLLESFEGCLDSLVNEDKDSPLHLACKVGFLEVVNLLLDRCSVTLKNRFDNNPIHVACQHRSCELIDSLLEQCSGNLDCHKNDRKNTFLHVAANYGTSDTVRLLLNHCSTTCQNADGNTPLHIACFLNKQSVVECLLDRMDSDHAFVNRKKQTYLHAACNDKAQLTIVKLLYEKGFKSLANVADENGNMPLHYAFRSNQKGIIEYLMTDGCCDPYKTNNDGLTPVYLAIQQQNIQLIEHILSKNLLDPNQPVKKGSPLLHSLIELPIYMTKQYPGILYPYNPSGEVSDPAMHYSPLSVQLLMKMLTDKTTNIDLNAPDSHGNTALHLACGYEQYESVRILVSTDSVGQSISHRNSEGRRPIQLTSDYRIIRLLISYGANPEDVYHRFAPILERSKEEQPLESAVKVIVIGNSTAGKTTLIETLRSDGKDVMEVKGATAGIEQTNYDSREFGKVVFHDFAGQPEYDSSHSAFLERCSSSLQPPLFLVVIDSSESRNNIEKQIHQWLSFVHNHCNFNSETPPHVIVIGSHVDILKDIQVLSKVQDYFAKAIENFKSSDFECCEPVFLDCRKGNSEGMKALQLRLKESCTSPTKFIELDCQCHILFANIVRWFPSKPVKIKDLQHRIKQRTPTESLRTLKPRLLGPAIFPGGLSLPLATVQDAHSPELLLPTSLDPLVTLLKSLHSGGHILLLDAETPEDSWIVMNQDSLFKEVNGILFAPQYFEQHLELENNTGVVPITKLKSLFPDLDFNMVRQFLLHYEFCQQIKDAKTLEFIHGSRELQTEQGPLHNIYYFFPGLIKSDKPTNVWDTPEDSPYIFSCGWMLQCQSKHFFETRFLHVLLLRLTFYFVESLSKSAVFKRRCDIWKNGIQWCTRDGVEVLVELVEEKSVLLVLVRCYQGQELEAIKLRTAVLKKVCQTREEFCPKVHVDEYLIHPSALSKSTPHSSSNDRISISEIAQTVIEGKPFVVCPNNKSLPLKALLYYEPYSHIGKEYIESFFHDEKLNESIPSDALLDLAKSLHPFYKDISKVLKIPEIDVDFLKEKWQGNPTILLHHLFESWASRKEHPTFQTLRSEFDEYSIFFGRDPLALCKSDSSDEDTGQKFKDGECSHCTSD